jgi:GTP cyclohydrolase IA
MSKSAKLRARAVQSLFTSYDPQPKRQGLKGTPARVERAWAELLSGYDIRPADFHTEFSSEGYDEMVCIGPVRFYSTCEHHMLPFFGSAWVAYVPQGKIIGLSKLPRIVNMFSRRFQNQERMTQQIVECIVTLLNPLGAACMVRGQHFCCMGRGVMQENAVMTTSKLTGCFTFPEVRAEFFELTKER